MYLQNCLERNKNIATSYHEMNKSDIRYTNIVIITETSLLPWNMQRSFQVEEYYPRICPLPPLTFHDLNLPKRKLSLHLEPYQSIFTCSKDT